MKKRKGFCLLPFLFILIFVGLVFVVILVAIYNAFISPTARVSSFKVFEQELIDEYGISDADVFIDTNAIEVYFSTEERVSLEEAREIMEITRNYMLIDENYEPFLESFIWENGGEPESVRIRFEPMISTEFYYQFSAESFVSTSWLFESNINNEYYYEEYIVFDFIKVILDKKLI